MAERPVFHVREGRPFYAVENVRFEFNAGFSAAQKRRNIAAIHGEFLKRHPHMPVLEISSKSMQPEGVPLSAFYLKKHVPSIGMAVPVECVFQSSKAFEDGGPYPDILMKAPIDAKRDKRLRTGSPMRAFVYEGRSYPLIPRTAFYNYIYISALADDPALAEAVMRYRAFTDIEFVPSKGINCQAMAAAVYVSLALTDNLDCLKDFDSFVERTSLRD